MSKSASIPVEPNFTMHNPRRQLLEELHYKGITQASVALTYAFLIAQEHGSDFTDVNRAIRAKWKGKAALERIKKAAWKHVEERYGKRDRWPWAPPTLSDNFNGPMAQHQVGFRPSEAS